MSGTFLSGSLETTGLRIRCICTKHPVQASSDVFLFVDIVTKYSLTLSIDSNEREIAGYDLTLRGLIAAILFSTLQKFILCLNINFFSIFQCYLSISFISFFFLIFISSPMTLQLSSIIDNNQTN